MDKKVLYVLNKAFLPPRAKFELSSLEKEEYLTQIHFRDDQKKSRCRKIFSLPLLIIKQFITCSISDAQIIHLSHFNQLFLAPVLKLIGKRVVYDAYERFSIDYTETFLSRFDCLKKFARKLIEVHENIILKYFIDGVLTVSSVDEYQFKRYSKYCINAEVLYNVPSIEDIVNEPEKKFYEETIKIVYVGKISDKKGVKKTLSVAAILMQNSIDFELHLAGKLNNAKYIANLHCEINNGDLQKKMYFYMTIWTILL